MKRIAFIPSSEASNEKNSPKFFSDNSFFDISGVCWAGFVTFGKTNAVFDNVTFTGTNYDLSGNENGYDIVELHNGSQGSNIVFKNCIFNLTKSGDAIYGFLGVQYSGNESYSVVTYENCKFILDGRELTVDEVITAENMDYTGATVTIDGRVINP